MCIGALRGQKNQRMRLELVTGVVRPLTWALGTDSGPCGRAASAGAFYHSGPSTYFLVSLKDLQKALRSFRNIKWATHNLAHKIVTFVIWFQRCEVPSESLKGLLRGSPSPIQSRHPSPDTGLFSLLSLSLHANAVSSSGPVLRRALSLV